MPKKKWLRVFLLLERYNTKAIAKVQKGLGLNSTGQPKIAESSTGC